MSALRRVLPLAGLVAAEVAALTGLHAVGGQRWARIDWFDLGGWLAVTPPADAAMVAVRLVGVALAWWLLATTLLTAVAALARAPALSRLVRPVTWSLARAAVDRAAAAGVSVALLVPAPPALAHAAPPPPGLDEPPVTAAPEAPAAVAPESGGESGDPERGDGDERARMHEVRAGEHLWSIAASDLADRDDRPTAVSRDAVARHWRTLVEHNRDRLRSGDPDLVYPGERLELPDPPA